MRLKILAISDTHLGEDTSLLSFPHGRQHLWKTLREQFSAGEKVELEEVILLGDIPDRTLSSTSQIITHTNAFIQMLGSAASIKKGVYVPGNHDHTLWTKYCELRYGKENAACITGPSGELVVKRGKRCDKNDSAAELLSILFGYPAGSSWRRIQEEKRFDFVIANPLYVTQINERTYSFAHGTHFRKDVTLPKWFRKLCDYLQLDKILGNIDVESDCNVNEADSLEKLEKIVAPFVDSLWPSSRNNPTPQSDKLWYLLTTLSSKFSKKRPIPPETRLFSWGLDLPQPPSAPIRQLTPRDGPIDNSIERWKIHFLPHMVRYLKESSLPLDKTTFVYGDTHDGGWGEFTLASGDRIRIYNCGGWVVHHEENHPACHLFAVDESGKEYLLNVSFKDVRVEEELLLKLASYDAENRYSNTSRILRLFLNLLPI